MYLNLKNTFPIIGFLSIDIRPFRYSSSLFLAIRPPGELISILSSNILILIEAFTSQVQCTKAFAIASRKAFSEPDHIYSGKVIFIGKQSCCIIKTIFI